MENATQVLLLYFIMPLWFVAGLADYLCHRATDIEHTEGPRESLLHLLMLFEISVPLLMCLFLEINAFVFAVMIVAFVAHQATALWDVSYAIKRRYISPVEQHVHSFLELIPLMAGTMIAISLASVPGPFRLRHGSSAFWNRVEKRCLAGELHHRCSGRFPFHGATPLSGRAPARSLGVTRAETETLTAARVHERLQ